MPARLEDHAARRGVDAAAVQQEVARQVASQRLMRPDGITACVAFLRSPLAGAVAGEALAVNGGAGRAVPY